MKIYVKAMSMPRDKALRQAGAFASDIIEHTIKIIVYSESRSENVDHWISEIAGWLYDANRITVKPRDNRLKFKDIEYTTFSAMGNERKDYEIELNMFKRKNQKGGFNYEEKEPYPDFEVTGYLSQELMDCCYDIMKETTPMIIDKKEFSKQEFIEILTDIFSRYM